MTPVLLVMLWEVPLLLASVRVAMLLAARGGRKQSAEEFFAIACSVNMTLEALPGSALSFAHANSAGAYAAIAIGLLLFGARPAVVRELASRWRALEVWRFRLTAAFLCAAAVPLFLLVLKPVDEWDSITYLHYLLEWRAGRATPYTFLINYVAFGPSRFLPAMVLARTDWYFAFAGLKPVLLLALGLYLAGVELEIPARLRIWTVAAAIALQHLWGCHSGVGTLKSDSLHAAGVVLLVLVLLRRDARNAHAAGERFDTWLFAFGLAFATEKYTGVFLAIVVIGALLLLRVPWRKLAPGAALMLLTTGHYYLRGLWLHRNPFFPFTVRLGPLELPGNGDLSATSILAHAREPAMWKLFFAPAHGISPAGLLFPLVLVGLLGAAGWVAIGGLRRRGPEFWMATLLLLGWAMFARTFWGAGAAAGSLGYLEQDLSTLRYVEGFLALGEIFLIWFLWKRGVPVPVLLVLVGVNGASRLWLLYAQPGLRLFPALWWIPAAAVAALLCFRLPAVAATGVAIASLAAAPTIVERNRQNWLPDWKDIYEPLRQVPAGSVFLLDDPASGSDAAQFALSGARLEHDVLIDSDPGNVSARYAIRMLDRSQPRAKLAEFAAALEPRGYRTVVEGAQGIILERVAPAAWDASAGAAWYVAPGHLAAAGVEIDAGDPAASRHRLLAGELVLSPPDRLWRVGPDSITAPTPPEGATLRVANCGRPPGVSYRFEGGQWSGERPLAPVPAAPVVSIERGKFEIEHLEDAGGPFLRLRALDDAAWLVLVTEFPAMAERAPFTTLWVARSGEGTACRYWLWTKAEVSDYAGARDGRWQTFRLLRRARQWERADHLAVGRKDVHAGDTFDVREAGVLAGYFP